MIEFLALMGAIILMAVIFIEVCKPKDGEDE